MLMPLDREQVELLEQEQDLLDQFATAAITGILAGGNFSSHPGNVARTAYEIARAAMQERLKDPPVCND